MGESDTDTKSSDERRRDTRVRVRYPIRYYFAHAVELVTTKVYRTGFTHDISEYGLRFEAEVLDPGLLDVALQGDVFVDVAVMLPTSGQFKARGRVIWTEPVNGTAGIHLLGIQFVVADPDERVKFWELASRRMNPVGGGGGES